MPCMMFISVVNNIYLKLIYKILNQIPIVPSQTTIINLPLSYSSYSIQHLTKYRGTEEEAVPMKKSQVK